MQQDYQCWTNSVADFSDGERLLFCFSYAGAGASIFNSWSEYCQKGTRLCAVQLPGRETRRRERHIRSLQELADRASEALRPLLRPPYAFLGYSMGAVLSYEITTRLQAWKHPLPECLVACCSPAPHLPRRWPRTFDLSDVDLIDRLKTLQGTPNEVLDNKELMGLVLPTIRADFEASQLYEWKPQGPLECPIVAVGALGDSEVSHEEIKGWGALTTTRFRQRMFQGGHFTFFETEEHTRELMEYLQTRVFID